MGNIVPEPTYQEKEMAQLLDTLAFHLGSWGERSPAAPSLHGQAVKLLRLALHRAEEYAAKVESDGEESATAAMLAADFQKGDDR